MIEDDCGLGERLREIDEVGKLRSVSMSPDDAQSVIATKRVGEVFGEYKSNSSVMIVLEGQNALGAEAHAFYDQMVKKLEADPKHPRVLRTVRGEGYMLVPEGE